MPKGTSQVIFECPESFRRRLYEEKLKRRMSIKRLIMEAVEAQWFDVVGEEIITLALDDPEYDERQHWADMFVKYMERCPPEKVKLLQSVIKEDLKIYKLNQAGGHKGKKSSGAQARKEG
jgi:hypothetical protein